MASMTATEYRVYGYRWVVLGVYMLAVLANQMLWITFAPITGEATRYFGVSDLSIGLLSMVFMIVYLFAAIPASWAIDTYGIRLAVGIGAVLTGVFGLLRGLAGANFGLVLAAQIGIALGQPFILNAVTTVAAHWFPQDERATAAGLGSLAIYVGILAGMLVTPFLALHLGLQGMLLADGVFALVVAGAFVALARERPPTPPCPPGQDARSLVLDGLKQMLRQRDFQLLLAIFFVGLGVFNAVSTWIEDILRPRGFSATQAGVTGGLMILGGIVGAIVLPLLSDHYRRRKPFLVLAVLGALVGMVGLTYAGTYGLVLSAAFLLGFFLLSAGPIGFQYGAEITYPAPEGTSNGLLLLMGQIAGIAFIFGMDALKSPTTGSMTLSLLLLMGLVGMAFFLALALPEAPLAEAADAADFAD